MGRLAIAVTNALGSSLDPLTAFMNGSGFYASLKSSLVLDRGTGSPTFTRASVATVVDHEGLVRNCISGEARFTGARRIENLISTNSEDFSGFANYGSPATVAVSTTDIPSGAVSSTSWSNGGAAYQGKTLASVLVVGTVYRARVAAKSATAGAQIMLTDSNGVGGAVTISSSWAEYSVLFTATATSAALLVASAGLATVAFSKWQIENVTGQSNQNPSEYVSVGVLSAPYHGAGVDGVKYFLTTNGNVVV